MSERVIDVADLLHHERWMRHLARSLVRDEHKAEDLVQQAWLEILQNPRRCVRAPGVFLGSILRSILGHSRRAEARRFRREVAAARPERFSSDPDMVLQRLELRQKVVEQVCLLDEPYRSTLLLRFFEAMSVKAIASRQGVPADTVKTRLRRGLDLLRTRLDRLYGGDRKAWCLAFLPLAAWERPGIIAAGTAGAGASTGGGGVPAATGIGAFLSGGVLMSSKALLATSAIAAVALLVSLGAGLHWYSGRQETGTTKTVRGSDVMVKSEPAAADIARPNGFRKAARTERSGEDRGGPGKQPAGRSAEELLGIMRDAVAARDFDGFKEAAEALGQLDAGGITAIVEMLFAADDPKVTEVLAWELVRHGGKEGMEAVAKLALSADAGLDSRARAIAALADAPPEARADVARLVAEVLGADVPDKLQLASARAYGRLLGPDAVAGLLEMVEGGDVRAEPLLGVLREFARADDIPQLTALAGRLPAPKSQEVVLRAMGAAAGDKATDILLDILNGSPSGVQREPAAWALEEFAKSEDLPRLWDALRREEKQPAEAFARAIARLSGREGVDKLLKLAEEGGTAVRRRGIIQIVEDFGDSGFAGRLGEMLAAEKDHGVAFHIAKAILHLDATGGRLALEDQLGRASEPGPRAAIAQVLGREGNNAPPSQR